MNIEIDVPVKLDAHTNLRMHWRAHDQRKKHEKLIARLAWCNAGWPIPDFPCVITFTRYGPRKLDDDNLPSAFKYIRDELCRCFGLVRGNAAKDDGDEIRWVYEQAKAKRMGFTIQISN